MDENEETLVRNARAGDRTAFEELVRRTSRLVFARLYLETGDTQQSEDLLQETMLTAYRRLSSLTDPKGFRSWLLAIAQNIVIDAARRRSRQKRSPPSQADSEAIDHVSGNGLSPDELVAHSELRDQMLAMLRSLPEDYRLPLTMRYIAGSDYESICTELGLSNGSLRGLLHRGLKMLRGRLEQNVDQREK